MNRASITNGILDPYKDQGMEERSKNTPYAIINVEDSSQCIDSGAIANLFLKYGSISSHRMGFELYLAKKIIEAHGYLL